MTDEAYIGLIISGAIKLPALITADEMAKAVPELDGGNEWNNCKINTFCDVDVKLIPPSPRYFAHGPYEGNTIWPVIF